MKDVFMRAFFENEIGQRESISIDIEQNKEM
jgi:hypothetical protein